MTKQLKEKEIPGLVPSDGRSQEEVFHSLTPGAGIRVSRDGRRSFFALFYGPDGKRRRFEFGQHVSSTGIRVHSPKLTLKEFENAYKVLRGALVKGDYPRTKKEKKASGPSPAELIPCAELPEDLRRVFPDGVIGGTVGALLADYLGNSPSVKRLKPRSLQNYKNITQGYLSSVFSTPVADFGENEVRDVLFKLAAKAPTAAPQVKNILSCAFSYARQKPNSGIGSNPTQGVRLGIARKTSDRYLKDSEIRTVLEALPKLKDQKCADVYKLVIFSMCRPGEAAGIKAEDIISDDGEMVWKLTDPKNRKDFLFPLYGPIGEIIHRRIALVGGKGRLFWQLNVKDPYPRQLKEANKALRELTGLNFRPHDLRRTGRTHISGLGIRDEVAESLLNHAKEGMRKTYNLYSFWTERKEALKLWHEKLSRLQATT